MSVAYPLPDRPRVYISGAGSGLGRSLALLLARRGARILLADVRATAAAVVAEEVRALGGEGEPFTCDVTRAEDVEKAAQALEARWGGMDLVINNAGVAAGGAVEAFPLKDWQWIVGVNFWGVLHGCHVFLPRLKAQGHGAILNVASAAGFATLPEMGAYNVTKAAVMALSETLFAEAGVYGVQVSVLCPTFFPSGLLETFRSPEERQKQAAQAFFNRSRVTAEDVAKAALNGVERGQLHIIPQLDGRLVWWLKRLAPSLYLRTVRRFQGRFLQQVLPPPLPDPIPGDTARAER